VFVLTDCVELKDSVCCQKEERVLVMRSLLKSLAIMSVVFAVGYIAFLPQQEAAVKADSSTAKITHSVAVADETSAVFPANEKFGIGEAVCALGGAANIMATDGVSALNCAMLDGNATMESSWAGLGYLTSMASETMAIDTTKKTATSIQIMAAVTMADTAYAYVPAQRRSAGAGIHSVLDNVEVKLALAAPRTPSDAIVLAVASIFEGKIA